MSYEQVEQANAAALRQVDQVKQSAQGFLQAAQSGGFGVSPDAGKAMLDAVHQCLDGLDANRQQAQDISRDAMLGTSPDAQVMIAFNKEVAAGADNSAASYLESLRHSLVELEAGINEAMKHYQRVDEDGAGSMNRMAGQ